MTLRKQSQIPMSSNQAPAKPFKCGMLRLVTETKIIWGCEVCDKEIKAGTGYLTLDQRAAKENARLVENVEYNHRKAEEDAGHMLWYPLSELMEFKAVPWQAFHRTCDPRPHTNDYWFDVGRVNTPRKFLSMVGHLSEKNWIGGTNLYSMCEWIGSR